MKKILFVGFYEPREHIQCIKELFEKNNFIVDNYPLFQYSRDTKCKIANIKDHLNDHINQTCPDIILWFFLDVSIDTFVYIKEKHPTLFYIMYNSDDPVNFSMDLLEKIKIFDVLVTPCCEYINKYKLYSGIKTVLHIPSSYDPTFYYKINNPRDVDSKIVNKYTCDISIFCLNLLENNSRYPNQYINRKQMINEIIEYAKKNNKIFKIYGPQFIEEIYKDNYGGTVGYQELVYLFNFSKINISTHIDYTKSTCFVDHDFKILGSGGLLFIDPIKDIEKTLNNRVNCVIINKNNYISQLDGILKNYSVYDKVKKNGQTVGKQYVYANWVNKVVIEIGRHYFSPDFYSKMYKISDKNNAELFNYWVGKGITEKHIPYSFDIPKNFDIKKYIDETKFKHDNPQNIYLDWIKNGKNTKFIMNIKPIELTKSINNINNIIGTNTFKIPNTELFNVMYAFNKIANPYDTDKGLNKLQKISIQNPNLQINELVDAYIKLTNNQIIK